MYVLRRSKRFNAPRRRGVTAVEFAITCPLVFVLFFGQLEFSRANLMRHSIQSAAYEGARRGIVPGASADDVQTEALTILNAVGTRNPTITVAPAVILADTPEVTVTVSISLNNNSWGAAKFFKDRTLSSTVTLKREVIDLTSFN
jgi:Flp pilus assembly protein TadG